MYLFLKKKERIESGSFLSKRGNFTCCCSKTFVLVSGKIWVPFVRKIKCEAGFCVLVELISNVFKDLSRFSPWGTRNDSSTVGLSLLTRTSTWKSRSGAFNFGGLHSFNSFVFKASFRSRYQQFSCVLRGENDFVAQRNILLIYLQKPELLWRQLQLLKQQYVLLPQKFQLSYCKWVKLSPQSTILVCWGYINKTFSWVKSFYSWVLPPRSKRRQAWRSFG